PSYGWWLGFLSSCPSTAVLNALVDGFRAMDGCLILTVVPRCTHPTGGGCLPSYASTAVLMRLLMGFARWMFA
ncbi:hypothetical protein, partial [Achromobacter spanius]|uniref:hypothetical protein n=1 Tax=Achromobacter spanius TaxID=217203 RepID=UPI001E60192C